MKGQTKKYGHICFLEYSFDYCEFQAKQSERKSLFMKPAYSVLLCAQSLDVFENRINEWLIDGIKVFWFGTSEECSRLKEKYPRYCSAMLLNCYQTGNSKPSMIVDGSYGDETISELEAEIPSFNAAQYRVEHCTADSHIIVEASAGTGKTTVMIDRIMFLLHTVPDIKMSDIVMITFTNEATAQMSERLQKVLLTRYQLTRNHKYLLWLEEQADMQISTIDSFSYSLIKKFGVVGGFSQQVRIKTLNLERKELIKDILNSIANNGQNIATQFGLSYYKMAKLVDSFWNRIAQFGLSTDEVLNMEWGQGNNSESARFQKIFKELIFRMENEYSEAKRVNDAVTLQELKRDMNVLLPLAIKSDVISGCGFRFLFVDEFQDSDNSQINMIGHLIKSFDLKLFVVGDVKQSIYRFRGAVDSAFIHLIELLKSSFGTEIHRFELQNNYRTSSDVLLSFENYFKKWANQGLLTHASPARPCQKKDGSFKIIRSDKTCLDERLFIEELTSLLDDFSIRCMKENLRPGSKNRVVVLTRTNSQVNEIARILDKYKIPAIAKRGGTFFQSEAVKDFFAFISSFLYFDEPLYMFNYLKSSFSGFCDTIELSELQKFNGDKTALKEYLDLLVRKTNWIEYADSFRVRPVLSVIKDVFKKEPYIQNFIARRKQIKKDAGWADEAIESSVYSEAVQYKANIDKLLEILHQQFKSDSVSVNKIVSYLKNAIATNREENEADADIDFQSDCVYCMTVHKAKGLEFDSVILPYMNTPFCYRDQTEILIDNSKTKIAWNISSRDSGKELCSNLYYSVRKEENLNAASEETRILYVAMTRTIHSFRCILSKTQNPDCWNGLFEKAGLENEQKNIHLY